ncbi:growth-regulated protein homolog gamma-like [Macrotis lagotis]|uniref:growth-regulated protein homolog gamma-like n=1 Tax=Macrotis lagotis TaxID=92651 RepID=UPI003D69CD1B
MHKVGERSTGPTRPPLGKHNGLVTMHPSPCAQVPVGSACLRSGLLPFLMLATLIWTASASRPVSFGELRCKCLKTVQGIHRDNIANLVMIKPGASCPRLEIIITLKKGGKICLNPNAPKVKNFIQRYFNNNSPL